MKTKIGTLNDKRRSSSSTLNLRSEDRKLVLVGDSCVGKTAMFYSYTRGSYPEVYVPTTVESQEVEIPPPVGSDDYPLDVTVWDTAGHEEFDRLRPMSYSETDAFIVCYSMHNSSSYLNVSTRWIPELRHFCPDAVIVLVATKIDGVQEDIDISSEDSVTSKQGKQLAKRINACAYIECSVNIPEEVNKVFRTAALVTLVPLESTSKKQKQCNIL